MGSLAPLPFQRPDTSFRADGTCAFKTIYDVLEWTAAKNPHHLFARQLSPSLRRDDIIDVSHSQLLAAVDCCAAWLVRKGIARPSRLCNGTVERGEPVGIFLGSDLTIFIYLLALCKLGNPYLLLSARLSREALLHLVGATATRFVLTDQRTWAACGDLAELTTTAEPDGLAPPTQGDSGYSPLISPPLTEWLSPAPGLADSDVNNKGVEVDADDCRVAIIHSTGSTGLPKPIFHCYRNLIAYANNHELPRELNVEADVTLNTLPLYHGFGLLAPNLSLSVGMACALPSASTIPTGTSVVKMLQSSGAARVFLVPSVLEEVRCEVEADGRASGTEALAKLKLIVVGGAPMRQETGRALAEANLLLLNHFGVSEIAPLAPILHPPPSLRYDWRYLLIRQDLNIRFRGGDGDESSPLQLGARPFGWKEDFWLQDALERNPAAGDGRLQVKIKGRIDDIVVLATGEKVNPATFESALREQPGVGDVVLFGSGRFQVGLLIESAKGSRLTQQQLRDKLWPVIAQLNETADGHAQVDQELVLLTDPLLKPLARTLKGNPQRKVNVERFAAEIDAAYQRADTSSEVLALQPDIPILSRQLRDVVQACLQAPSKSGLDATASLQDGTSRRSLLASDDTDFFEAGMDSLKALRLRRLLDASLQAARPGQEKLPALFVYHNPTVANLSHAIKSRLDGDLPKSKIPDANMDDQIDAEVEESVSSNLTCLLSWWGESSRRSAAVPPKSYRPAASSSDCLVLTGTTGKLGGQLLRQALVLRDEHGARFSHIYCLVRGDRNVTPHLPMAERKQALQKARERQEKIMLELGAPLSAEDSARLSVWPVQLNDEHLGLDEEQYVELTQRTSHIVHNAWPVDFLRPLASFEPHIQGMARILLLSAESTAARRAANTASENAESQPTVWPTRLLFTSSIAVIAQWTRREHPDDVAVRGKHSLSVPEELVPSARYTAQLGYAHAKLACELLAQRFADATRRDSGSGPICQALLVRVGQLTGEEGKGNWTTSEHMAMLAKSSLAVGALPDLASEGPGTHSWIPVDRAAKVCLELLCAKVDEKDAGSHFLHMENPARQEWTVTLDIMGRALGLFNSSDCRARVLPLPQWLQRVRDLGVAGQSNPAHTILRFLEEDFRQLGTGRIILGMNRARRWSAALAHSQAVDAEEIERYVHFWRSQGFLDGIPGTSPGKEDGRGAH